MKTGIIYKQAKETEKYNFISGEKALELAGEGTLLIVVDTHRPSYVSCPGLLEKAEKIAVIDHHRRAADFIKNADLSYIESYASSACELVSEILQYSGKKRVLQKLEAEALLGGITLDTNRFAVKTGVRTFEGIQDFQLISISSLVLPSPGFCFTEYSTSTWARTASIYV